MRCPIWSWTANPGQASLLQAFRMLLDRCPVYLKCTLHQTTARQRARVQAPYPRGSWQPLRAGVCGDGMNNAGLGISMQMQVGLQGVGTALHA